MTERKVYNRRGFLKMGLSVAAGGFFAACTGGLTPELGTQSNPDSTPRPTFTPVENEVAAASPVNPEKTPTTDNRVRGLSAPVRGSENMLPADNEAPYGYWDATGMSPAIHAELEDAIVRRSFSCQGKLFFLDRYSGVLGVTGRKHVYMNTSLSVIPDEGVGNGYVAVLATQFDVLPDGSVVVYVAQANPGHDEIEIWKTYDGFNYVRIK